MRNRWLMYCLVAFAVTVLLRLFDPWVDDVLYYQWRHGPVDVAVSEETAWNEDELKLGGLDILLEDDLDDCACFQKSEHYLWNRGCDRHYGPEYPVTPPWVPYWIVNWTELRHIIPDYTEHCPDVD